MASGAESAQQPGAGVFLLAWGLFASVIGLGLVTDFRGFASGFTRSAYASSAWLRRVPPWKWMHGKSEEAELADRRRRARLLGIPFAVLGPIVTVAGVAQLVRGHMGVLRGPALPLPIALVFIGFTLVVIARNWRPGGIFWLSARWGGWRRGAAIAASLGAVSFSVFTALGFTTLGIAGWAVGGLCSIPLAVAGGEGHTPTRDRDRLPAQPSEPREPVGTDKEDDDGSAFRWL